MQQRCKFNKLPLFLLLTILLWATISCATEIQQLSSLKCHQFQLKIRMDYSASSSISGALPFSNAATSDKESSSLIPRIVVPLVAVVVVGTTIYLLYSQRGG